MFCPTTQERFRKANAERPDGWLGVVEEIQRQVAREFHLPEHVGVDVLRRAEELLPGDKEVIEISHYRKYNRCRDGNLAVGDAPPDAPLLEVDSGNSTTLGRILDASKGRPVVVFAASYT